MKNDSPSTLLSTPSGVSLRARRFSKTLTVTYLGMGWLTLLMMIAGLGTLRQAVTSGLSLLLLVPFVLLCLGVSIVYVMWALHMRRNWARYLAVSFWLLCLIGSSLAIVRNGLYPAPAEGPFKYSNEDQVAGARFAALVTPYFMVVVELSAMFCLLRKASVVNQFKEPKNVMRGETATI